MSDIGDNIKVVVKVRPLIYRELDQKQECQWRVKNNTLCQLDQNGRERKEGPNFTFDKVYDEQTQTCEVYNDIAKPIVEAAIAGFNGTIFAYGQTSSGKTYTMTGTDDSPGIIPLAVLNIFEMIKSVPGRDFLVRVSYIEIYNELVNDLLNVEKKNIKPYDSQEGVKIDATEKVTVSPEEVLEIMKQGDANRHTGATNMNERSSRSHTIFQITIESREHIENEEESGCVNVAQLNLVDLAGSERAGQTGATGLRFKEGTHINKTLSVLALVIKQLSEGTTKHVSYRDSKLTFILQNSLGGNAKTSIICAVTPATMSVDETISTLQFANRAKAIKNKPEVNAVATERSMIQELTKKLSKLQSELENKKHLEQNNVKLQNQIASMQKLILNGFGQRSRRDMLTRRLQPPRRKTISSLHDIHEDSEVNTQLQVQVPKFRTPCLKYNPALVSNTSFLPVPNTSKLAPLPEDVRLVTPPPHEQKTKLDDEIIDLDSDDEIKDPKSCSPYHNCHLSSKTPPCVLRKQAKLAEKKYEDIIELTNIEKMYSPKVVELMQQNEQNVMMVSELKDKLSALAEESKTKDEEVKKLQEKINKAEQEVKEIASVKANLEVKCKEYDTKLTDWEVSYETLKKKSKNREAELVSLLEDHRGFKKTEDNGIVVKSPAVLRVEKDLSNLMDMSKDISLVASDESMTSGHPNVDTSNHIQDLVGEMQLQLTTKNNIIIELEASILSQKEQIDHLESSAGELQGTIDSLQDKLAHVEGEVSLHLSTIKTMNSTIENHKELIEKAHNDIQSYVSLIQELQIKLQDKENVKIDNSVIESLIASEEMVIANNDNIKNIIQSFKTALETKNKEIDVLKSCKKDSSELPGEIGDLRLQIESKEKQIDSLVENIEELRDQLNENSATISQIVSNEQETKNKLTEALERNDEIQKHDEQTTLLNDSLKQDIAKLTASIAESEIEQRELLMKIDELKHVVENLTTTIKNLEDDIVSKDNLFTTFNKVDQETKTQHLSKARITMTKMQELLLSHKPDAKPVDPNTIENLQTFFDTIDDSIHQVQGIIHDIISSEKKTSEENITIYKQLLTLKEQHVNELNVLYAAVESAKDEINMQNTNSVEHITQIAEEKSRLRDELVLKNDKLSEMETLLDDAKIFNEKLSNDLLQKNELIQCLEARLSETHAQVEALTQSNVYAQNTIKELEETTESTKEMLDDKVKNLLNAQVELHKTQQTLAEMDNEALALKAEVQKTRERFHQMALDVLNKTHATAESLNVEMKKTCDLSDDYSQICDEIIKTLNNIVNYNANKQPEICENCRVMEKSVFEKSLILNDLTKEIEYLKDAFTDVERKNKLLQIEIENYKLVNSKLSDATDILNQLKQELNIKSEELNIMERNASTLKVKFTDFELEMKKQIISLKEENEKYKEQINNDKLANISKESKDSITKESSNLTNVPQSLLTICCNKIIDSLQNNEIDSSVTTSSSKSSMGVHSIRVQEGKCDCKISSTDLTAAQEELNEMKKIVLNLELENKELLKEREEVRRELHLLIQPASELQKKIANHRTNLSTLTATTYAENKLLHSQLKVLKHHHTRYIHVCQRDIPAFKSQLGELMMILKDSSSFSDKHNASFKRYSLPDVLDSNTTMTNFKNESTLDGELLMLDTNVTLSTSTDNTLIGHDQTCLDVSQNNFEHDVVNQTIEKSKVVDPCEIYYQIEILSHENRRMLEKLDNLELENSKLRSALEKYSPNQVDSQNSPVKFGDNTSEFNRCDQCVILDSACEKLTQDIDNLVKDLANLKLQKDEIENKYNDLILEMPSADTLKKINILEKESNSKVQLIEKINSDLNMKKATIKELQKENDDLSTQVTDYISEADDLKKELDTLKDINLDLMAKITSLESDLNIAQINKSEIAEGIRKKINRSLSESQSSSKQNKISTLKNEINASKEDCKKLTEEVSTIKNQIEIENRNDSIVQAMDLDESMNDSNIFTLSRNLDTVESHTISHDSYLEDKTECYNYFIEKTGIDKENLNFDVKIIEVMKMLYNNLLSKHSNEVENLSNRLKDFEESKSYIQSQFNKVTLEFSEVTNQLQEKDKNIANIAEIMTNVKKNLNIISEAISESNDEDKKHSELYSVFKDKVLKVLDTEFGIRSADIYEVLINKSHIELTTIMERHTQLQEQVESVLVQFSSVSDNLNELKQQLAEKEEQYNLVRAQKEKVHEICNAVTLDIVRKEEDLRETLQKGCEKLLKFNIISPSQIEVRMPLTTHLNLLLEHLIKHYEHHACQNEQNEKEIQHLKVTEIQDIILEKEKELVALKSDLKDKEEKLTAQKSLYDDLNKVCVSKEEENKVNLALLITQEEEIKVMKSKKIENEQIIKSLQDKLDIAASEETNKTNESVKQLITQIEVMTAELETLKSLNAMINKEKDNTSAELDNCREIIKQNKAELDKINADLLILKETTTENVTQIETLKTEAKSLHEQNIQLKNQYEIKCQDCLRLEMNIKTHEKTAEIQSKMIIRLQKQKEDDNKSIDELKQKSKVLQQENDQLKADLQHLTGVKESLESRVSELENRSRSSLEGGSSRRRRQSLVDSKRTFAEDKIDYDEHQKMEAVFGARAKPDDLFMDVDEDSSNRSTPIRRTKRESLSRQDQSDKEDEPPSRPSSVMESRRRRQSLHDQRRTTLDTVQKISVRLDSNTGDSELSQLRHQLSSCQQELGELKERYKELDEECETCAQYLRERDEQCVRLKREKTALESQVKELNDKLDSKSSRSNAVAHASVNTDEDWANLHAVVVDRMSFDAEVEKNKRLTKTNEELQYKKQELKNNIAKMQKALDKYTNSKEHRELQTAKAELRSCKQELIDLRERNKELDEECETCAQYLRERDEQCRRLKEAKLALEAKLEEYQASSPGSVSQAMVSVRKKRQSLHDQNRASTTTTTDAATETSDDFLSYQVERDDSSRTATNNMQQELKYLKKAFEAMAKEKAALEKMTSTQMYVATGSAIVQNQQLTDVLKENQKLKKMNAKLVQICKKRSKSRDDRENESPSDCA